MQASYGENEIKLLLQKVRIFNRDIGSYQVFAITENFDYTVKISNGRILLKLEELQDDERDALTPDRLTAIANRFVSFTSQTTQNQQQTAQPQSNSNSQIQPPKKKGGIGKTTLVIVIVLIVLVGGLSILNNVGNDGGVYGTGDSYQERVMTIEEIERSQPTDFLSADGTYRENFWGDKIKVNCVMTNRATVATYKDAVVRITYYTKTKTELGSKDYTIYEVFPPNSTKTVELKIDNYKDVNSIGWDVISAAAY